MTDLYKEVLNYANSLNTNKTPNIIALVGPTASGKSDLGLKLAKNLDSFIVSIDSLSVFKEINIASAKPSQNELDSIKHYGINVLNPNESCNAIIFKKELEKALLDSIKENKKFLFIVGGSGFYLDSIIKGLSPLPESSLQSQEEIKQKIKNLESKYEFLQQVDLDSSLTIKSNDTYRINKLLEIYFLTNIKPSEYFKLNPPTAFKEKIHIFNTDLGREKIRERIQTRTKIMLDSGLIDEAKYLLKNYGESIQGFNSIGLKECLLFLNNKIDLNELENLIYIHTCQLAKRQRTFNKSKFVFCN